MTTPINLENIGINNLNAYDLYQAQKPSDKDVMTNLGILLDQTIAALAPTATVRDRVSHVARIALDLAAKSKLSDFIRNGIASNLQHEPDITSPTDLVLESVTAASKIREAAMDLSDEANTHLAIISHEQTLMEPKARETRKQKQFQPGEAVLVRPGLGYHYFGSYILAAMDQQYIIAGYLSENAPIFQKEVWASDVTADPTRPAVDAALIAKNFFENYYLGDHVLVKINAAEEIPATIISAFCRAGTQALNWDGNHDRIGPSRFIVSFNEDSKTHKLKGNEAEVRSDKGKLSMRLNPAFHTARPTDCIP
jgi:hypothetical protein